MSNSQKGRTFSQESIEKMRKSQTGVIPWNKGKKMSEEIRNKMREGKRKKKLEKEL
jgi:hypothetical protein